MNHKHTHTRSRHCIRKYYLLLRTLLSLLTISSFSLLAAPVLYSADADHLADYPGIAEIADIVYRTENDRNWVGDRVPRWEPIESVSNPRPDQVVELDVIYNLTTIIPEPSNYALFLGVFACCIIACLRRKR